MIINKKLIGGKVYGKGVKGMAINTISKNADNLYKMLTDDQQHIKRIYLIGSGKVKKEIKGKNISSFLSYLQSKNKYIAKIFFTAKIIFRKNIINKDSFYNELTSVLNLVKIYKKDLNKYTTVMPLVYKGQSFYGIEIDYDQSIKKNTDYILFYKKCKTTVNQIRMNDKMFRQFIKQILQSLIKLQDNNFNHCDIKPDNIVICDDGFKLIDWDMSHPFNWNKTHKYSGTPMYTSPLTHYLNNVPKLITKNLLYYYNIYKGNKKWVQSKQFSELYDQIKNDFDKLLELGYNRKKLFDLYYMKFDLFNFGLVLSNLIFINKLNFHKYKLFIQKIIAFDTPVEMKKNKFMFENAHDAYNYFIKNF
jgi:serine/threonine protein kinase